MSYIEEDTLDYIKHNGFVTCEFTTSPDKMPEVMREIWKFNDLLAPLNSYWHISVCKTCHEQRGDENYIHIQIVKQR